MCVCGLARGHIRHREDVLCVFRPICVLARPCCALFRFCCVLFRFWCVLFVCPSERMRLWMGARRRAFIHGGHGLWMVGAAGGGMGPST